MQKYTRMFIFYGICLMIISSGIGLTISHIEGRMHYYASGQFMMNTEELNSFKHALYQYSDSNALKDNIRNIETLDYSGDTIIVYNDIKVISNEFPFGNISEDFNKSGSYIEMWEIILISVPLVIALIVTAIWAGLDA